MGTDGDPGTAWRVLADTLLQREALVCRLGDGMMPHDFAGLYVGNDEVDRILAGLPGMTRPGGAAADELFTRLSPEVDTATARFVSALDGDDDFARLVRNAGLSASEATALAVLAAVEGSPHRMRLVAYVQDNVQLPRLTLATLDRMLGVRLVGPGSPLRTGGLVDVGADGPWANTMCWPAPRVMWALAGDDSPDPDLPPGTRSMPVPQPSAGEPEVLVVSGSDADSRLAVVRRRWPRRSLLACPVPASAAEWAAVIREATVGGTAVVLELAGTRSLDRSVADRVTRATRLSWVISSPADLALESLPGRPWTEIRVESGLADAHDWSALLGVPPDPAYPLSREQLRLVSAASGRDPGRIAAGVRRLAGGHLDGLAVRIQPRRTWQDLVLPRDQAAQVRELVVRFRKRATVYREWGFSPLPSTGVVGLFAGPSGTGKTLAAEIVAGELGVDLYKINLSSVVSKYIGETEKNLERLFDAASAGDLVLFFDEADALFGKRSEVTDAHDRYANIEVAYLLQRLETYQGVVVLATNLQRNIDDAFLRRISVSVNFELPDEPRRLLIWQRAFPPDVPAEPLDLEFLARQFRITGGVIRNASLGAAFLAAAADEAVTMERIVLALKREFQKLGRLCTESEFDRYFHLVNGDGDAEPA